MKTLSRTFAIITGLVAGLVWPAAASERHPGDDQSSSDSSKFGAAACRLPQDSHVQFMNGKDAFKGAGGGGSYGDIFFAGGAGARTTSHGGSSAAAPAPHGATAGSGGGAASGGGSPAFSGGGAGGGTTMVPPTVTQGPGDAVGNPGRRSITEPPADSAPTWIPSPTEHRPDFTPPGNQKDHGKGKDHPKKIAPKVTATPEPASAILLGTGILGLAASRLRRWRKKV